LEAVKFLWKLKHFEEAGSGSKNILLLPQPWNIGDDGGVTRPLPRDGVTEKLHGDPTVGPHPQVYLFVPSLSSCHEKARVALYFGRICTRL